MKTKILRNIFLSVGVLFASARLLSAGMNVGVLNFGNMPLVHRIRSSLLRCPGRPGTCCRAASTRGGPSQEPTYEATQTGVFHGFLRAPDGTFTTIDPPGSTGAYIGCFELVGQPINPAGAITGNYFDASGWITASCGLATAPSPRSTAQAPHQRHFPQGINPAGAITGFYFDASFVVHGFLRARDGTFTTFDAPGAVASPPLRD